MIKKVIEEIQYNPKEAIYFISLCVAWIICVGLEVYLCLN